MAIFESFQAFTLGEIIILRLDSSQSWLCSWNFS